jgi:predicted RNA-binding protein
MTIILTEAFGEEKQITDINEIKVFRDKIIVEPIFGDSISIENAFVERIDCLEDTIFLQRRRVYREESVQKTVLERMKILLPHWLDHNRAHAAEFADWACQVQGDDKVKGKLLDAAKLLNSATDVIYEVGVELDVDGLKDGSGGHHTHCHDHEHSHHHPHDDHSRSGE